MTVVAVIDGSTVRVRVVDPVALLASVTVTAYGVETLEAVAVPVTIPLVDITSPLGNAVVAAKLSWSDPPVAIAAVKVVALPCVMIAVDPVTRIGASTVRVRVAVVVASF
jgi:hypothetical protein